MTVAQRTQVLGTTCVPVRIVPVRGREVAVTLLSGQGPVGRARGRSEVGRGQERSTSSSLLWAAGQPGRRCIRSAFSPGVDDQEVTLWLFHGTKSPSQGFFTAGLCCSSRRGHDPPCPSLPP